MGLRFSSIPEPDPLPPSGARPYVGVQKSVRMSRAELEVIYRAAKARNMTTTAFIRESAVRAASGIQRWR